MRLIFKSRLRLILHKLQLHPELERTGSEEDAHRGGISRQKEAGRQERAHEGGAGAGDAAQVEHDDPGAFGGAQFPDDDFDKSREDRLSTARGMWNKLSYCLHALFGKFARHASFI